jgi:hypothetical protein
MNDHPMFKEWDAVYTIWKARQDFHNALREKYPDDHPSSFATKNLWFRLMLPTKKS